MISVEDLALLGTSATMLSCVGHWVGSSSGAPGADMVLAPSPACQSSKTKARCKAVPQGLLLVFAFKYQTPNFLQFLQFVGVSALLVLCLLGAPAQTGLGVHSTLRGAFGSSQQVHLHATARES